MKRRYTNFDDIDRDLRFLKLQTQIDKEELKLRAHNIKETLSPLGIITNVFGAIAKKAIVLKAIDKLVGFKRVKKKNMEEKN